MDPICDRNLAIVSTPGDCHHVLQELRIYIIVNLVCLQDPREKLIMSLKREVKILRQENHYLRNQLEFPVKPRGQLQKENDKRFLELLQDQQKTGQKVITDHGLYEMLQEYMIENESLR